MKKLWLAFMLGLVALPVFPAWAEESTEEAEESATEEEESAAPGTAEPGRSLAERIPSVTARVFRKKGRVELFPAVGYALNDPFFNDVMITGGLAFHALESLSIGVVGDFYAGLPAKVPIAGGGALAKPKVNRPAYAARLKIAWSPLYGKVSLFAEKVLHFDMYVLGGGGVVAGTNSPATVAGVVGLGQHFFINDYMALRLEIRDEYYKMSRDAAAGGKDKHLQSQLSAALGLCFYLPSSVEREAL